MTREDKLLLIPGPTPVPPRLLRAQSRPMMNHRAAAFRTLFRGLQPGLQEVFRTSQEVLVLTASGTGGLEAALVNTLSPGDRVLAVTIGAFGERWAQIAEAFGLRVERLAFEWGRAADPAALRERLAQDSEGAIRAVLVTHNETSTGVTNDIRALAEVVRGHGALLQVDAISGLIAAPLETDAWGLDVVVAGSQKAFMIPPGLTFVSVSERAWEAHRAARLPRFYWDWTLAHQYAQRGETPATPAVSLIYALSEALEMIREEGLAAIQARHTRLGRAVRAALQAIGLELLVKEDRWASPAVTAALAPAGVAPLELRRVLEERYGVVIAGGQGPLKERLLRIGHLGYVDAGMILYGLAMLELALRDLGVKLETGTAVAAAQEAWRA